MWKKLGIGLIVSIPVLLGLYVWVIAPVQRCPHQSAGVALQAGGWRCLTSLPTARSELGVAALDGRIYAAGGMNRWGRTAAFEVYDPRVDEWRQLAALPLALNHLGIAAAQGRIYVTGGYSDLFLMQSVKDAWAYDPATDTWGQIAALPAPRAAHVMISIGEKLYVVGGTGDDSAALWVYDPATNIWDTTRARMPTALEHAAAAVVDGKLYVISGRWGMSQKLAAVEVYDPASDSWTRGRDIPTARGGLTAAALDGRIHVTGGEDVHPDRTFDEHHVYDPASDTWTTAAALPAGRHGLGSAVIEGRWYVVGGATRPALRTLISATALVDVYSP